MPYTKGKNITGFLECLATLTSPSFAEWNTASILESSAETSNESIGKGTSHTDASGNATNTSYTPANGSFCALPTLKACSGGYGGDNTLLAINS